MSLKSFIKKNGKKEEKFQCGSRASFAELNGQKILVERLFIIGSLFCRSNTFASPII